MAMSNPKTEEGKALLKVKKSMDSKKSRPGNDPSMAGAAKYVKAYEDLKAIEDTLDPVDNRDDLDVLRAFENDGYLEAAENDDITLIQKKDKGHGANAAKGGDFKTAFSNGDVKRCLEVLKNRIRSGFATQEAKDATLDALMAVSEMDGAEPYAPKISAAIQALQDADLGVRHRVSGNTYVIHAGKRAKAAKAVLIGSGITNAIIDDEGNVTFNAAAGKAEAVMDKLIGRGFDDIDEQTHEVKNPKTDRTFKLVDLDELETAEIALEEEGIEIDPASGVFTINGTEKQVAKVINKLQDLYGLEIEEA